MNRDWFTKHATELSTTDLSKTIDNMQKWNARASSRGHQGRHGPNRRAARAAGAQ